MHFFLNEITPRVSREAYPTNLESIPFKTGVSQRLIDEKDFVNLYLSLLRLSL